MSGSVTNRRARWSGRTGRQRRLGKVVFVVHWLILLALVAATLLTAVLLDQQSRLFLLKIVLAAALTLLPAWIFLLFISTKGQRLYDEFVINLYRLRIDRLGNLPAPPPHTTYYGMWKQAHDQVREATGNQTSDNLHRAKFEAIYGVPDRPPDRLSSRQVLRRLCSSGSARRRWRARWRVGPRLPTGRSSCWATSR